MSLRQTRLALLVVVALTAITLWVHGQSAPDISRAGVAPASRSGIVADPIHGPVAHAVEVDRRDTESTERTRIPRIGLFGVLLLAVGLGIAPCAGAVARSRARRASPVLCSPRVGRAPPHLVAAIA